MFDDRRKRRQLEKEIVAARQRQYEMQAAQQAATGSYEVNIFPEQRAALRRLAQFESRVLIYKARELGIEIPSYDDKQWWLDDSYDYKGSTPEVVEAMVRHWLSDAGRFRVGRLIREEKQKIIEWWVKVITPLLGALISLLGLLVALITITRK